MTAKGILTAAALIAVPVLTVSAVTLTPVPTRTQMVNYTQGAPTLVSPGKSIASATLFPEANGHIVLFVAVKNQTRMNLNLGVENVSAAANGQTLHVFSYDELARKIESAESETRGASNHPPHNDCSAWSNVWRSCRTREATCANHPERRPCFRG